MRVWIGPVGVGDDRPVASFIDESIIAVTSISSDANRWHRPSALFALIERNRKLLLERAKGT